MSQNKLIGWVLEIASGLCIILAIILSLGACSTTVQGAAFFTLQTCDQTTAELLILIFFSIVFAIVGVILLRTTDRKITVWEDRPRSKPKQYCQSCESRIPFGAAFCHKCGAKQTEKIIRETE